MPIIKSLHLQCRLDQLGVCCVCVCVHACVFVCTQEHLHYKYKYSRTLSLKSQCSLCIILKYVDR